MQAGTDPYPLGGRLDRLFWVQIFIAFALIFLATILGAFSAHALEERISGEAMEIFMTGNRYHFYFSFAILAGSILWFAGKRKIFLTANWFFLAGIICFSFSLYLLGIRELLAFDISWVGPVTPLGGLLFIAGSCLNLYGCYQILRR